MRSLKQVNNWARLSCPRWNKNGLTRRWNRAKYRKAAQEYWESPEWQEVINKYKSGIKRLNTYPWPYASPDFANWEEDDSPDGYSLISDQSGCVIRYATSYCAWKIFEATGKWPQKQSRERLDAKRWQQFLAEAGYSKVVERPEKEHSYVGIIPNEGEWGLVVWAESEVLDIGAINISTYIDGGYIFTTVDPTKYTWVEIN